MGSVEYERQGRSAQLNKDTPKSNGKASVKEEEFDGQKKEKQVVKMMNSLPCLRTLNGHIQKSFSLMCTLGPSDGTSYVVGNPSCNLVSHGVQSEEGELSAFFSPELPLANRKKKERRVFVSGIEVEFCFFWLFRVVVFLNGERAF
ncbi:hypothetical protein V6N13_123972 [Hibiscus sabdariffa]